MSGRKIDGTFAFVTSADRGIGYALTEALLRRGAEKVYAAARDPAGLAPLSRTYGARIVPVTLDVTDADQVAKVAREARDVRLSQQRRRRSGGCRSSPHRRSLRRSGKWTSTISVRCCACCRASQTSSLQMEGLS